ncbi:MAG: diacylglycerol/lipid kinase family protein [Bacteroidia bacterium]
MSSIPLKILAIINPISGGKKKSHIPRLLNKHINHNKIQLTIAFSKNHEHVSQLTLEAIKENVDAIIAVGGDGTINTIAKHIVKTKIALGIIPMGSGNGLANELGISKKIKKAINIINNFYVEPIDCGRVNNHVFLNILGTGFDAQIGYRFNNNKTRGLFGYIVAVIKQLFNFTKTEINVEYNNNKFLYKNLFLATVGNGTQFGNNAYITPKAKVNDGLLNLTVVTNINIINALKLTYALFSRNFKYCENFCYMHTSTEFKIKRLSKEPVNIDGECEVMNELLDIIVEPKAINLIIPYKNEQ